MALRQAILNLPGKEDDLPMTSQVPHTAQRLNMATRSPTAWVIAPAAHTF